MDERKAAVEILELARKHLDKYDLIGAIQHVYQYGRDQGVPWAREDAWHLANDAVDEAIFKWRGRTPEAVRNLPVGRALLEAAQREGRDLIGDAIRHVTRCERCEGPGKPISITDNLGDLGKINLYLCGRCEGLRRANDPGFTRWLAERLSSPEDGQKE